MKKRLLKSVGFYILFFFLLYFEDRISFFNISLSNIWKIVAISVLLLIIIWKKKKKGLSNFDGVIILLAISFFINGNSLISILDVEEILIILIFPISYYSFYYLYKPNFIHLKLDLLILSTFLILTALPFLLNIIQPISEFSDNWVKFAEGFKFSSEILVGFFKHPSISSKVFVFSLIVVWVFGVQGFKSKNTSKIFFLIILVLGLYNLYRSFTRTGWLMLIIFLLVFVILRKGRSKFKKILILLIITGSMFYIYETNEAVQNRIIGNNVNRTIQIDNLDIISSGRNILILQAIKSVIEEDNITLFFGLGKKYYLEKNDGALAHNRLVDIFAYGGLVSLALYLLYLFLIYIEIRKRKTNSLIYTLSISLYIIMILALLPSHGLALWSDVIFGGIVALNRIQFEITNKIRLYQGQKILSNSIF